MQHLGGLLHRQSAEEPQLDDAALLRVEGREPRQRFIEREQIDVRHVGHDERIIKRDRALAVAAFASGVRARVIDQNAPHRLRGDAEKVRAILPAHVALIDQLDERFVDERGRLQCVIGRSRRR